MKLTSKINLNTRSAQSLRRSLRMESLEARQMLSAVSIVDNPIEQEAQSAYFTELQPTSGNVSLSDVDAATTVCAILDAEGATVASFATISEALDSISEDSEGKSLQLLADVEGENIVLPENVALLTNGYSFKGTIYSEGQITVDGVVYGESEESLSFDVANNQVALVVTSNENIVDSTDGETSLSEALAVNAENGLIKFADDLNYLVLDANGLNGNGATLTGDFQLVFTGDSTQISNLTLDGVQILNTGDMTISDVTFTGDYSDSNYVVANMGEMTLENVVFTDIYADVDLTADEWYGMDAERDLNTFSVIDNLWGDMTILGVQITNVDVVFTTDRLDNFAELNLIANAVDSNLLVDGLLVAENTLEAKTNRGDVSAFLNGIRNEGLLAGANILMFGNSVSTSWDLRFTDIADAVKEDVVGIATYLKDVELTNVTMLEKLYGYRADFFMANSIYSESLGEFVRGFLETSQLDGEDAPNLKFNSLEDLEAIFPAYDAETNLFSKNEDGSYDLRMWLDSAIVDAGNNDFSNGLTVDVIGSNRFNNEIVDLGAVEANAQKLVVDGLVATPEGTDTAILTWNESENATGYVLRYYTASSAPETISESDWTEVTGDSLDDLEHILDGLAPGTYVAFQVMALGDNLSWLDSDWSETAYCFTKTPLATPELNPALEKPLSIDLSWLLIDGASTSAADAPYTLEFCKGTLEGLQNGEEYDWTALPNAYTILTNYATLRVSDALEGVTLEYNTTYLFRIKANGTGNYVDSEYAYTEKTTGGMLVAPELTADERTDSAITVVWNDEVNQDSQIKSYEVRYRVAATDSDANDSDVNNAEWISINLPLGANVESAIAENLDPATKYEFQIRVLGQQVYNDSNKMADDSEWSEIFTFSTKAKLAAPAPTAEGISSTEISVSWDAVENASGYLVVVKASDNTVVAQKSVEGVAANFDGLTPETTYTIEVVAVGVDEYMNSEAGYSETTTWIKLQAPTMTQKENSTNHVVMTWNEVANSSDYVVEYSLTGPDATDFQAVEDDNLSVTVTEDGVAIEDIAEVRQIWFRIMVKGQEGVSEDSEWSTVYVGSTKGELSFSENGLTAEGISTSEIKLSWDAVVGAQSYKISYKTGAGAEQWITIENSETTETTITGLTHDTLYDATIQAIGDGVNCVSSEVVNADATTWLQLNPPTITINDVTDVKISGTIAAVDFATGYEVEFSVDGGETWTAATVDGLAFTATVDPNTTCVFRVRANGSAPATATVDEVSKISVDSEWGDYDNQITSLLYLDAPEVSATVADSQKSVTITWTAIENAEKYHLIVTNDANGEAIFDGELTDTEKVLDVDPNRAYSVVVKAIGNGDNIKDSDDGETSFTTQPLEIGNVSLNARFNGANDTIVVSWNEVEGADEYTLEYQIGNGEWQTLEIADGETSVALQGDDIVWNAVYNFKITVTAATDYTGESSDTATVATPHELALQAVVLKQPSDDASTTIPTTEKWVDEWTNVYLEIWVEDALSLAEGREITFQVAFDDMYTLESTETAEGIVIVRNGDVWTVTVEDYEAAIGADMLVRLKLVVNTGNGVNWEDRVNEEAFSFKDSVIDTDVYAVPGDMNDDGEIRIGQNDADDAVFDSEMSKTESWADFDHDGKVDLIDRQWMINNNYNKSWANGDTIIYTEDALENGPFNQGTTAKNQTLEPTATYSVALQKMPEAKAYDVMMDEEEALTINPIAVDEADPIPVVKEENALTDNSLRNDRETAQLEVLPELSEDVEIQALDYLFGISEERFFA